VLEISVVGEAISTKIPILKIVSNVKVCGCI
jgi:hypothetical protein